jgi:hypothetical protein
MVVHNAVPCWRIAHHAQIRAVLPVKLATITILQTLIAKYAKKVVLHVQTMLFVKAVKWVIISRLQQTLVVYALLPAPFVTLQLFALHVIQSIILIRQIIIVRFVE